MTNTIEELEARVGISELEEKALEAYGKDWKYDSRGQWVVSKGLICDQIARLRGWGHLTGGGALNMETEEAAQLQDALGSLIAKLPRLLAYCKASQQREAELVEVVKGFKGAAYSVCDEINPRGHNWCESYLDEVLPMAIKALNHQKASK